MPAVDQRLAERHAVRAALLDHGLHELALGESELDDHVADAALGAGALVGGVSPGTGNGARRGGLGLAHASVSAHPAWS